MVTPELVVGADFCTVGCATGSAVFSLGFCSAAGAGLTGSSEADGADCSSVADCDADGVSATGVSTAGATDSVCACA